VVDFDFQIIRSNRRSLGVTINRKAEVIVRAPNRLDYSVIQDFLEQKSKWILKKQQLMLERNKNFGEWSLKEGEVILYLGKPYRVRREAKRINQFAPVVGFENDEVIIDAEWSISEFRDFLRKRAGTLIQQRVEYWSGLMKVDYKTVRITDAKQRWGSCSRKNYLNFAWRLILAPINSVDYVVVHELSHVQFKNHGRDFWNRVESVLPDYRFDKKWLQDHAQVVNVI
jgi:predicted metal-dependent hydrolase